jgi:hypothetical protein
MKYASPHQNLSMTLMREGQLVKVKFVGGIFDTDDPATQAALEKHPTYGRTVYPVGRPASEIKLNPSMPEMPAKKAKATRRKRSPKKVDPAKADQAIERFMK